MIVSEKGYVSSELGGKNANDFLKRYFKEIKKRKKDQDLIEIDCVVIETKELNEILFELHFYRKLTLAA